MRIRLIPFLAVAVLAGPAAAQATQPYRSDAGFTLQLPARWQRMADEELAVVRRSAARTGMPITYESAFRVGKKPWPAPPVAAVARMDLGGTITLEEFGEAFAAPDAQEAVQAGVDQTAAARLGGRAAAPEWDAENGIAWVRVALQSGGTTSAFSLMAATLNPAGDTMIALVYYGEQGEDETRIRANLLAIIRSLRAA